MTCSSSWATDTPNILWRWITEGFKNQQSIHFLYCLSSSGLQECWKISQIPEGRSGRHPGQVARSLKCGQVEPKGNPRGTGRAHEHRKRIQPNVRLELRIFLLWDRFFKISLDALVEYFGMQIRAASDQTVNLLISIWPALPPGSRVNWDKTGVAVFSLLQKSTAALRSICNRVSWASGVGVQMRICAM